MNAEPDHALQYSGSTLISVESEAMLGSEIGDPVGRTFIHLHLHDGEAGRDDVAVFCLHP